MPLIVVRAMAFATWCGSQPREYDGVLQYPVPAVSRVFARQRAQNHHNHAHSETVGMPAVLRKKCAARMSGAVPIVSPRVSLFDQRGDGVINEYDGCPEDSQKIEPGACRCGAPKDCAVPEALDIKPGSCPNPVNPKSKGVEPMAVVGSESFDVMQVDIDSLTVARADGVGGFAAQLAFRRTRCRPGDAHRTWPDARACTKNVCAISMRTAASLLVPGRQREPR